MGSWLTSLCGGSGGSGRIPKGHPSSVSIRGTAYKLIKLLGEGGYAYVYLAQGGGSSPVAIKRFVLRPDDHSITSSTFLKEVDIQAQLSPHPNIVQYVAHDVIQGPVGSGKSDELWVVMELCSQGSLQEAMNLRLAGKRPHFSAEEVMEIVSQVVSAVCHMHRATPHPIAHWDLKLDNVLIATTLTPDGLATTYKLCDFGSASTEFYQPSTAKDIYRFESDLEDRMTLLYQSPESLDLWSTKDSQHRIDTQCDVWGLGVLTYVLLYHTMPFEENKQVVMDGKVALWEETPPAARTGPQVLGSTAASVNINDGRSSKIAQEEEASHILTQHKLNDGASLSYSSSTQTSMLKALNQLLQSGLLVKDPTLRLNMFQVSAALHQIYPPHVAIPIPGGHGGVQTRQKK